MKKALVLFLCLLLSLAIGTAAYAEYDAETVETDTLTWDFDAGSGTLSIHGSGPMRDYSSDYPEWEDHRDEVITLRIDEGVTSVGAYAFFQYQSMQTAVLPDSIRSIGCSAFDNCWELSSITVPASLEYVAERAFYNTLIHDPSDFVLPEGCRAIGAEAFHSALKSGSRLFLPSTLSEIGDCAFTNGFIEEISVSPDSPYFTVLDNTLYTKDLSELLFHAPDAPETECVLPEGLKTIRAESFNVIQNVEKIDIPSTVSGISEGAFFSTFQLKEISVSPDNPNYKSVDGLLYTADGTVLLAYPDGIETNEITVADGVERIGNFVFYGHFGEIDQVILPDSIRELGMHALCFTQNIGSVYIPAGLTRIEGGNFYYEGCVHDIYYEGSEEDWAKIAIEDYNDGLASAVMHYNSAR